MGDTRVVKKARYTQQTLNGALVAQERGGVTACRTKLKNSTEP